jgi:hypothetical protein
MPLMMAHDRDAYAVGDFPEQEMIWEAPQVDPPAVLGLEVETLRVGNGLVDKQVQLLPEFVAEPVADAVVVAQNPGDIT